MPLLSVLSHSIHANRVCVYIYIYFFDVTWVGRTEPLMTRHVAPTTSRATRVPRLGERGEGEQTRGHRKSRHTMWPHRPEPKCGTIKPTPEASPRPRRMTPGGQRRAEGCTSVKNSCAYGQGGTWVRMIEPTPPHRVAVARSLLNPTRN